METICHKWLKNNMKWYQNTWKHWKTIGKCNNICLFLTSSYPALAFLHASVASSLSSSFSYFSSSSTLFFSFFIFGSSFIPTIIPLTVSPTWLSGSNSCTYFYIFTMLKACSSSNLLSKSFWSLLRCFSSSSNLFSSFSFSFNPQ